MRTKLRGGDEDRRIRGEEWKARFPARDDCP